MYIEKHDKRSIEFAKIRQGTVLTHNDGVYIKGSGESAVDLKTGQIIYPANDGQWEDCLIYPYASVNLYRQKQRDDKEVL